MSGIRYQLWLFLINLFSKSPCDIRFYIKQDNDEIFFIKRLIKSSIVIDIKLGNDSSIETILPGSPSGIKSIEAVYCFPNKATDLSSPFYPVKNSFIFVATYPLFRYGIFPYLYKKFKALKKFILGNKNQSSNARHNLLGVLIRNYQHQPEKTFSCHDLSKLIYGNYYVYNFDFKSEKQLNYQLNSLYQTGELIKETKTLHNEEWGEIEIDYFMITGKTWKELSDFEENNKRHKDNLTMHRTIAALTIVIAFFSAVQSQLIDPKTWFGNEFNRQPEPGFEIPLSHQLYSPHLPKLAVEDWLDQQESTIASTAQPPSLPESSKDH